MIEYKAEAVLGLSNFGGLSIMLDPESSDHLYYQYYDSAPEKTEIYYMIDEYGTDIAVFEMDDGAVYRIDQFMRI